MGPPRCGSTCNGRASRWPVAPWSASSPFRRGPLNRLADVELLTADWVHWYNTSRLMHRLGRIPPAEHETAYYAQRAATQTEAHQ